MHNTGIQIVGNAVTNHAAIIVVGLSRGGTSAIAASLDALGVSMGKSFHKPIYEDLQLAQAMRSKDWRSLKAIIQDYETNNAVFGWKLPDSYAHLDRIYQYFTNPYFIFVYKDVFAVSMRRNIAHGNDVFQHMGNALDGYEKILKFIRKKNPNALHVSYEKMIANKDEYAEQLALFCNIPMNHALKDKVIQSIDGDHSLYDVWTNANSQRTLLSTTEYDGYVDQVSKTNITGWFLKKKAKAPITLELVVNDCVVKQIECDLFRKDLIQASLSLTGNAGFNADISDLALNHQDEISLRVKGTSSHHPVWKIKLPQS